jgi:hypothetical protein
MVVSFGTYHIGSGRSTIDSLETADALVQIIDVKRMYTFPKGCTASAHVEGHPSPSAQVSHRANSILWHPIYHLEERWGPETDN